MKSKPERIEKVGRRWMILGLVAVPVTGFVLLMGAAKKPEESRPATSPEPVAVRTPAARPVKPAPAPAPVRVAAPVEEPVPARAENDGTAGPTGKDPLQQLLSARPELADSLKTLLENKRPVAVMPREQMLALRGTPDDVIELIKLYHEAPGDEVRDEIFSAACTLSNPDSAGLLFQLLNASGEPDLTTAAELSLARMADSTLLNEIIARYEAASTPEQQARMLGIIYQIRSSSRVPTLIDMAEQQADGEVASALRQTLGMIGSPEAVEYLLGRLVSAATPEEEASYAEALSWVVDANSLPALIATATDGSLNRPARAAAVQALGNFAPEHVESLLGAMVSTESDAEVRQAALDALARVRSS